MHEMFFTEEDHAWKANPLRMSKCIWKRHGSRKFVSCFSPAAELWRENSELVFLVLSCTSLPLLLLLVLSPYLANAFCRWLQGVPTGFGYTKCNALKLRKVCERSELRLQKGPKKGGISTFNDVTGSKFKISPFLLGQNSKFTLFIRSKFEIHPFLLGQDSKFTPFYWVNIL